jgi:hypothetical protein
MAHADSDIGLGRALKSLTSPLGSTDGKPKGKRQ